MLFYSPDLKSLEFKRKLHFDNSSSADSFKNIPLPDENILKGKKSRNLENSLNILHYLIANNLLILI